MSVYIYSIIKLQYSLSSLYIQNLWLYPTWVASPGDRRKGLKQPSTEFVGKIFKKNWKLDNLVCIYTQLCSCMYNYAYWSLCTWFIQRIICFHMSTYICRNKDSTWNKSNMNLSFRASPFHLFEFGWQFSDQNVDSISLKLSSFWWWQVQSGME